jgi:hypothetical protein
VSKILSNFLILIRRIHEPGERIAYIVHKETKIMRYLCLIYSDERQEATAEEQQTVMAEYYAFTNDIQTAGVSLGGEALQPTTTATTVRVRNGKTMTTDGPFAETKEQLGGYYLLNCKDLDEAIQWAAKIPGAKYGSIEVRPIWEFGA